MNFSIYVYVFVFCACSLKLISKILTSLYGNTTGFFWRSRQDSLPYRNHFASERSLHSLLSSWRISKSSSNCFRRRWMSSADRLKLSIVTAITKGLDRSTPKISFPMFSPFDSTSELWTDYGARFQTFVAANAIPGGPSGPDISH